MAEAIATISEGVSRRDARGTLLPASAGVAIEVLSGAAALDAYDIAARGLAFAPPQSPAWVRAWAETVNPDIVVGVVRHGGRILTVLPLEVVSLGPFRVARFPGGSHANGNFAPTDRVEPPLAHDIAALIDAVSRARPDIDLVLLERLCPGRNGLDNPLAAMAHTASPDVGLAINLDGGFEGVMSRVSGKRKRKRFRSQTRKYEAVGPIDCGRAASAEETAALLDTFFALKGERLRRMGADDVFADAKVRAFFHRLFGEAAGTDEPAFVIDRLAVGGVVRAITGSSLSGDRLICEFSAIRDDDLTSSGPGDFLFHENIAAACAKGRAIFDFSVGDERYKREWCDIETVYADVRLPLGFRGAALAGLISARAGIARFVKSKPALWAWLRRLRRRQAEPAEPRDET